MIDLYLNKMCTFSTACTVIGLQFVSSHD